MRVHRSLLGPLQVCVVSFALKFAAAEAQPMTFTHLAGSPGGAGWFDGAGKAASFAGPSGVAVDASGNIFVAEFYNQRIRKIAPSGIVTTLAGSGYRGSGDGAANAATFNYPQGVAVDKEGRVLVADTYNHKIRRITQAGFVTTLAGSGSFGGADGAGSAASFDSPTSLAVDASGVIYVAENFRLRRMTADGVVTTLAGTGKPGTADGTGSAASFNGISGIAVDSSGTIYATDGSYTGQGKIRNITAAGVVTTVVRSILQQAGDAGPILDGIAIDNSGNLIVTDWENSRLLRITSDGRMTILAGSGRHGGSADGVGIAASFLMPSGIAIDARGNVIVADSGNNNIRTVTPDGHVSTVAGSGVSGSTDGVGAHATFFNPTGVVADKSGNVYVADQLNNKIRKISPGGHVSTLAGSGDSGEQDGHGMTAAFNRPTGLTICPSGDMFVADTWNSSIRKISPAGDVTTATWPGYFQQPTGLACDALGNLYVVDTGNSRIRKLSASGVVTTLAGGDTPGHADGTGTTASFWYPTGVALGASGDLYVADEGNRSIRRVTPDGVVTTLTGLINELDQSVFSFGPSNIAVDGAGNLYVTSYSEVLKITPMGSVVKLGGGGSSRRLNENGNPWGSADGTGNSAGFSFPRGLAVGVDGTLYVADTGNNSIRMGRIGLRDAAIIDRTPGHLRVERQLDSWPQTATSWHWTLISQPAESRAILSSVTVRNPVFVPDAPGDYVFQLRAIASSASSVTYVTLHAIEASEEGVSAAFSFAPVLPAAGERMSFTDVSTGGPIGWHWTFGDGRNDLECPTTEAVWCQHTYPTAYQTPGTFAVTLTAWNDVSLSTATRLVTVSPTAASTPVSTVFVPVILSSAGKNNSFFTSEMTITNPGSTPTGVEYTYHAAFGGGSGTAFDVIGPGRQVIVPDAIAYLKRLGVPIPDAGNRGGSLLVDFLGLERPGMGAITIRTTTPVPTDAPTGAAGLAYAGVPWGNLFTGPAYLCGLRQTTNDRTNVAVQNAGRGETISLRISFFGGDGSSAAGSRDVTLPPGGFVQYGLTDIAPSATQGYVRVERLVGVEPFYAYAVINDNGNSDGSFIVPVSASAIGGAGGITVPVVVETPTYSTEVMIANVSQASKVVQLRYESSSVQGGATSITVTLLPGQQQLIPNFVQTLRDRNAPGVPSPGAALVGALFATVPGGGTAGLYIGARTSNPGGGGRYGLFYQGVPFGHSSQTSTWLYGLQQNENSRSNLALINTAEADASPDSFTIDVYDGDTGAKAASSQPSPLAAGSFTQINSIFKALAPGTSNGYIHVTRIGGQNPFIAYAVINDGAEPGLRSGDGSFLVSVDN